MYEPGAPFNTADMPPTRMNSIRASASLSSVARSLPSIQRSDGQDVFDLLVDIVQALLRRERQEPADESQVDAVLAVVR